MGVLAGATVSSRGIIRTSSGPVWATEWDLFKKEKKRQEKPPYIAEIILGGFYLNKIIFKILFKGNVSYRYNIHMVEIAYGT